MFGRWLTALVGLSHRMYIDTVNTLVPFHPRVNQDIWVLGVLYNPTSIDADEPIGHVEHELLDHLRSIPYLTYRHGFSYGLTDGDGAVTSLRSDAGWGCTLRTTQMMTSNGLQSLVLGSDWRRSSATAEELRTLAGIAYLFRDSPNAPLGIHQMTQRSLRLTYGKVKLGGWTSPSTAAQAMVEASSTQSHLPVGFMYVLDALVIRSRILEKLEDHPTGVLVYIPLVLGSGNAVDPLYKRQLMRLFHHSSFLGMVGGELRSQSFYFVGASEEYLLYLDPHFSRPAMETTDELHAVMPPQSRVLRMPWSALGSSMTLGFAVKTVEDVDELFSVQIPGETGQLFDVVEEPPKWVLGIERDQQRRAEVVKKWVDDLGENDGDLYSVSEEDSFALGSDSSDDEYTQVNEDYYVETGMTELDDDPDFVGIHVSGNWEQLSVSF